LYQLRPVKVAWRGCYRDHDVHARQPASVLSKGFTNQALDPGAVRRLFHHPFRYRHAEPGKSKLITPRPPGQWSGSTSPRALIDTPVVVARCKSAGPWKRTGKRGIRPAVTQQRMSSAQTSAALRPAGIDDGPALLGFHSSSETMGPFPLQFAGLECTFHDAV